MYDWEKMKKIIILIPVYNDWESLKKLLLEINENIKTIQNISFNCFVINDSSTIRQPELKKPLNISSFKILNMKKNEGHARCNAFGIKYIIKHENFDYIILMDGDGEDRPIEIESLVSKILNYPNISVVAKRIKRSDGFTFKILYQIHKLITFFCTGKNMNFGNYSCLTKNDAKELSTKASLWSSYSGTVKKYLKKINEIDSIRGKRYFGPSKMSIYNLLIHSFSIIAVFKFEVYLRVLIFFIIFGLSKPFLGTVSIFFQLVTFLFAIIIFLVSFRENKKKLENSLNNLRDINEVTH